MALGQDLFSSIEIVWVWLALLIFLLFRIEKPANYYFQLGLNALDDDKPESAIEHFKNALTKKSDYPQVRAKLSQLYVDIGDARSAECLVKQNIAQGFELENSVLLLAKVYFYQNKITQLDKHVLMWQNNIDLSTNAKEKLALYSNLILVHRRALPPTTRIAKPDIFDTYHTNSEGG
jgi:tetratricopeptide (TPR) repeat protein